MLCKQKSVVVNVWSEVNMNIVNKLFLRQDQLAFLVNYCQKLQPQIWFTAYDDSKAEVGSLFLVSSGKNPMITFQYYVIQVVWKNSRCLHLSLALYSDLR